MEVSYRRLLDDKAHFEDTMRVQIDFSFKDSNQLKTEVEDFRAQINLKTKLVADLTTEIQRQKNINQRRDEELYNIEQDLKSKHEASVGLQNDFEQVVYDLSVSREQRNRLISDNNILATQGKDISERQANSQYKLTEFQYQAKKQQDALEQIDSQLKQKEQDIQRKQDALYSTNAEIQKFKDINEELRRRETSLEGQIVEKELQNKENDRTLSQELTRLSQLRTDADDLERENQVLDQRLVAEQRELEAQKSVNRDQTTNVEALKEELIALEKHIFILDQQNKALFQELEKFAVADDMIKNTLDKRSRVKNLKEAFQRDIKQSQYNMSLKSPRK